MEWRIFPISAFEDFRNDWDRLNSENANTPLLDSRFVTPLLKYFGTQREKLAVCTDKGRPCCMAIVVRTRFGAWQTFQPSQAPIGCWVQQGDISTEELGQSLRKALPGIVLVFGITQQDPDLLPRPEHSASLDTLDYIDTARVSIDRTFEEYWAKRGKNLRQNLRRQRNRLGRENICTKLVIDQQKESIRPAVEKYGDLESAGWKSESNTAIHIDNNQGRFYQSMLENFAASGEAVIFQYYYNDELVATDLCVAGNGSIVILKTTYDETIKTSSPAMLMREEAFSDIFSRNAVEKIEFYGKMMDWHTKWTEEFRTMYHINAYSVMGSSFIKRKP